MDHETPTPAIDVPAVRETPGVLAMRERVSGRLFGVTTPQTLGRYQIERRIGVGGMGVVYAAFDAELSRQVAIKLVRTDHDSEHEQHRLRDEARALAQLSHPNVVQIHEVGVHDGQLYLVMEYVVGKTLDQWVRDRSTQESLRCCIQAGRGLAAAHAAGLLHRDIKPNNILVGDDGRARVVDFGLARAEGTLASTTPGATTPEQTARLVGTPAYVAPELYAGQAASPLSDQFGYCVTVWQLLTGTRPFDVEQIVAAAQGRALRPASRLRPQWLRRVLLRGLEPEPAKRWPSMVELLDEIEARPRRRALVGGAIGSLTIATGLLAYPWSTPPVPSCPDSDSIIAEVWGATRRQALMQRMDARPDGAAEFAVLVSTVDEHARTWVDTHAQACSATRIEGSRTEAQFERTVACLERVRRRLDVLLLLVEHPPAELELRRLLAELRDPRHCLDPQIFVEQLAAAPQIKSRVARLRAQLDEVSLLAKAEPQRAAAESSRVLVVARELEFVPLLAEASFVDGTIATQIVNLERAQASLREAAHLAKSVGDGTLEFTCLRELVRLTTEQLEDPERAADLLALMLGSFEQLGRPPTLLVDSLVARSQLARARESHQQAEALLRQALERGRATLGDDDVRVQQLELDLANVIAEQGRLAEAIGIYEDVLARLRQLLGPRHPELASVSLALAITAVEHEQPELARAHVSAALDIRRERYGGDSPQLAPALVVLAQVESADGNLAHALALVREAWPLERGLPHGHSQRGNSLRLEGALLIALEDYAAALRVHELMDVELRLSLSIDQRLALDQSIGWLRCRALACAGAQERFEAVLAVGERESVPFAQLGLVEVDLAAGRAAAARERLDIAAAQLRRLPNSVSVREAIAEAEYLSLRCDASRGARDTITDERVTLVRAAWAEFAMPGYIQTDLEEFE